MRPPGLFVRGVGTYVPPGRITVQEAVRAGYCDSELAAATGLTSVAVADGTTGIEMAVEAGRRALTAGSCDPSQLDLLVHATMLPEGPEGWSPAGYVLRRLGCGPSACHEVRQGCNGMFAALELAACRLTLTDSPSQALLTTALRADTPILDRWQSAGLGMQLGDGASAVLLAHHGGIASVDSIVSTTFPELEGLHRGSTPPSEETALACREVDISARVREFVGVQQYGPLDLQRTLTHCYVTTARQAMSEADVTADQLARVLFMNAGGPAVDAGIMQPLGLPLSRATWDFGRTIGHLGASDQIVSLHHLITTQQLASADRVLLVGGTQGYNAAAAVLTITGQPPH